MGKLSKRQLTTLLISAALCIVAIGGTLLGIGIVNELRAATNQSAFYFDDSGDEVTIEGLRNPYPPIVIIPNTINGKPVTRIGDGAFNGLLMLEQVVLPTTLTHIGANAFTNIRLSHIFIPASVTTIGASAFNNTRMIIYIEAVSPPDGWDTNWNSGHDNVRDGTITRYTLGELIKLIEELGDNNDRWTRSSWDNLMEKLADAKVVHGNLAATHWEIERAYTDLFRAKWDSTVGLRPFFSVNRFPLIELIGIAEKLIEDWQDEYKFWTPTSWATLAETLEAAKEITDLPPHDERAPQSVVNQAFAELNRATRTLIPIDNFVLPPEEGHQEDLLELLVTYVQQQNRGDHADMLKWYDLRRARVAAEKTIAGDGDALPVDEAFYGLMEAYSDLMATEPDNNNRGRGPVSPVILLGAALVIVAAIITAFTFDYVRRK